MKKIPALLFLVLFLTAVFSIKLVTADPGRYTVTIRSGDHIFNATSCVISRDPHWYGFNFVPEINLGPGQEASRTTPDINTELGGTPTDFTMNYVLNGEVKSISIGPVPPLELGKWYPLGSSSIPADVTIVEAAVGVGGIIVPVDKFGLLAPYIGLTSTIVVASVATAVYVKRRKEKQ
jgi:hypothetical protein